MTGPDEKHIKMTLESLQQHFQIRNKTDAQYALGVRFQRGKDRSFFLSQTTYVKDIIKTFGMEHVKNLDTLLTS